MGVCHPFALLCLCLVPVVLVTAASGGGDGLPWECSGSGQPLRPPCCGAAGAQSQPQAEDDSCACNGSSTCGSTLVEVSWHYELGNHDCSCCCKYDCSLLSSALLKASTCSCYGHHNCNVTVTINCTKVELKDPFHFLYTDTDQELSSLTIKGASTNGHRQVVGLSSDAMLSFEFKNSQSVEIYIENLEWNRNKISANSTSSLVFSGSMMSVEVINNAFVSSAATIRDSNYSSVSAGQLGLQISDVIGNVCIQNSRFEGPQCEGKGCGGVLVELSKQAIVTDVSFHSCSFVGLSDGAVSIAHNGGSLAASFYHCTFQNNSAVTGGAIALNSSHVAHTHLTIDSCNFTNNSAAHTGGALSIAITNSHFASNSAKGSGGALAALVTHAAGSDLDDACCEQCCKSSFIVVQNTIFANNSAYYAGSALWMAAIGNCFPVFATLNDCTVERNNISSEDGFYGMGAVFTQGIPIRVEGSTALRSNSGSSALVASSASITFAGNGTVQFADNSGYSGGALYLVGSSQMILQRDVKLNFSHNIAIGDSIMVYHFSPTASPDPLPEQCFMQFEGNVSDYFVHMDFTVFSNIPKACGDFLMKFNSSGAPQRISFHVDNNEVILGDTLVLNCSVTDYFNNPVEAVVNSLLLEPDSMEPSSSFYFDGGDTLTVLTNNGYTTTQLRILGPEVEENKKLVLELSVQTVPRVFARKTFTISHCRLGYSYNNVSKQCQCESTKEHLFCQDANTARCSTCIQYGYWFGDPDGDFEGMDPKSYLCPFANCNFTDKQKHCGGLKNYAAFESSDDLCATNRMGFLCAKCKTNSSFNFNAHRCVPMKSCNEGNISLLVFIHLLFWAFIGAAAVFVLKYHLRVGSGHLYCLVYYFALLRYMVQTSLHNEYPDTLIHILASPFDLYPDFIDLNVCLTRGFSSAAVLALHYIHPVILACLLTAIVIAFRLLNREEAKKRLVQAICIFLFLSFTTLTETSLLLLRPVTYIDHSNTSYDEGHLEYYVQESTGFFFTTKQHVYYVVLACLTLLLYSIPFTLLVLFSPYLFMKEVRLTSWLRPVFEEFQLCYKKRYRSFAGFYIVCRMVLFGIPLIGYEQVFLFQCFSVFVLIVHASLQPYSSLWLNAVDTILLGDLTLFTLSLGLNANTDLFTGNSDAVFAVRWILIALPGAYLLGLVGYQLVLVFLWPRLKKRMKKLKRHEVTSTLVEVSDNFSTTEMESTPQALRRYYQSPEALEREPLLFEESIASDSYTRLEREAAEGQNPLKSKGGGGGGGGGRSKGSPVGSAHSTASSAEQHIGINNGSSSA